jgi:hypothetical protein
MWDWLGRRRIEMSWSWTFNGPDAGKDKCLMCAVERKYHGKEHKFVEREDRKC